MGWSQKQFVILLYLRLCLGDTVNEQEEEAGGISFYQTLPGRTLRHFFQTINGHRVPSLEALVSVVNRRICRSSSSYLFLYFLYLFIVKQHNQNMGCKPVVAQKQAEAEALFKSVSHGALSLSWGHNFKLLHYPFCRCVFHCLQTAKENCCAGRVSKQHLLKTVKGKGPWRLG